MTLEIETYRLEVKRRRTRHSEGMRENEQACFFLKERYVLFLYFLHILIMIISPSLSFPSILLRYGNYLWLVRMHRPHGLLVFIDWMIDYLCLGFIFTLYFLSFLSFSLSFFNITWHEALHHLIYLILIPLFDCFFEIFEFGFNHDHTFTQTPILTLSFVFLFLS